MGRVNWEHLKGICKRLSVGGIERDWGKVDELCLSRVGMSA